MRVLGRIVVGLVGAAVAAAIALGATIVIGIRRRDPRVLRPMFRMQRDVLNMQALSTAGQPGDPHAIIRHVGRTTGREYATPVGAVPEPGGFVIALPYGTEPQWVRNVLAAGEARLEHDGRVHQLHLPEVVAIETTSMARDDAWTVRLFGIREALRLTVREGAPG
ncbi:nitroreductase family deazaflavin-dependent oxidoreductase [Agromyces sp. LHK192]|uniref:nitroreductase family deazaflavin-dependent oxidoreductase n=1 Tax=Agromyces sp. LHK192 TaxID=2498704 RepID=UPI0013E38D77|nr:nitroreductase family deazaflavin-dependent oxidoreductase [Agromyces sp. LHK192]